MASAIEPAATSTRKQRARFLLFDNRVAVHAAAGGTQRVKILIRGPCRQLGGDRGGVSDVDGDALGIGLNQPVLADGVAAHAVRLYRARVKVPSPVVS